MSKQRLNIPPRLEVPEDLPDGQGSPAPENGEAMPAAPTGKKAVKKLSRGRPKKRPEHPPVEYMEVTLRLPIVRFDKGSVCTHINLQDMTPEMRVACERIRRGCRADNSLMMSGAPVITGVDATRYLFEQIAIAMEITDGDIAESFGH